MSNQRYYVDIRVCCVVVRDRQKASPPYSNISGVIRLWKFRHLHVGCPTCGSSHFQWDHGTAEIEAAENLVAELNAAETKETV